MNRPLNWFLPLAAVSLISLAGCASTTKSGRLTGSFSRSADASIKAEITNVLDRQAAAWNRGDIDAFMEGYWNSPELSFSAGGKVTRGFEPTRDHFRTSYPDRAAMGRLTFSDLEITPLCRHAALVLGRWRLDREKPVSGAFSLTMKRINGQWLIIHDHTSRDAT